MQLLVELLGLVGLGLLALVLLGLALVLLAPLALLAYLELLRRGTNPPSATLKPDPGSSKKAGKM